MVMISCESRRIVGETNGAPQSLSVSNDSRAPFVHLFDMDAADDWGLLARWAAVEELAVGMVVKAAALADEMDEEVQLRSSVGRHPSAGRSRRLPIQQCVRAVPRVA